MSASSFPRRVTTFVARIAINALAKASHSLAPSTYSKKGRLRKRLKAAVAARPPDASSRSAIK